MSACLSVYLFSIRIYLSTICIYVYPKFLYTFFCFLQCYQYLHPSYSKVCAAWVYACTVCYLNYLIISFIWFPSDSNFQLVLVFPVNFFQLTLYNKNSTKRVFSMFICGFNQPSYVSMHLSIYLYTIYLYIYKYI